MLNFPKDEGGKREKEPADILFDVCNRDSITVSPPINEKETLLRYPGFFKYSHIKFSLECTFTSAVNRPGRAAAPG